MNNGIYNRVSVTNSTDGVQVWTADEALSFILTFESGGENGFFKIGDGDWIAAPAVFQQLAFRNVNASQFLFKVSAGETMVVSIGGWGGE